LRFPANCAGTADQELVKFVSQEIHCYAVILRTELNNFMNDINIFPNYNKPLQNYYASHSFALLRVE
jgi:hypothetical protein